MDDLSYRVVVSAGRTWTIREVDTEGQSWALAERCLICEDGTVVRRFWQYPDDWRDMPGEKLASFCLTASPVLRPPTSLPRDEHLADAR
jgi:hypothetical protein